ncbi:Transglutaminase-like superfamily protein [Lachnospiraceae bacterium NK3A20]|nr:Transglutaminase-like superfamily protein [Lachnospiraceae bacterium NK3A20]
MNTIRRTTAYRILAALLMGFALTAALTGCAAGSFPNPLRRFDETSGDHTDVGETEGSTGMTGAVQQDGTDGTDPSQSEQGSATAAGETGAAAAPDSDTTSTPDSEAAGAMTQYAYSTLDASEQTIYQEVLGGLTSRKEVSVSTLDKEKLNKIYNDVMSDHPEIFYVDGYTCTTHTIGGELSAITFEGSYICNEEEERDFSAQIQVYADRALAGLPDSTDDYLTVRYLYEYIVQNTDYDLTADHNQNILSVCIGGRSVCNGYAKALQYLLQKAGIPAFLVTGKARGAGHAWDLVFVNGSWYYVDPTWGDASFSEDSERAGSNWINYDYLCVTTKDIFTTHEITSRTTLPACTALSDNYYVREGSFFYSYDPDQMERVVEKAGEENSGILRLRCASQSVYDEMLDALIEQQGIYDYLPDVRAITYTKSDELYTLSIIPSQTQ